jgi:hypothetical protein
MFYREQSDQYITEGTSLAIDGTSYPSNWLNMTSPEDKAALGLVEVTDANAPEDDRFYWVSATLEGAVRTYLNTPKDLDMLKTNWAAQIRATAYSMLVPTDYIDSRKANDPAYTPPEDWIKWRASVRTAVSEAVVAINESTDIKTLQDAVQVTWPTDPDYKGV